MVFRGLGLGLRDGSRVGLRIRSNTIKEIYLRQILGQSVW